MVSFAEALVNRLKGKTVEIYSGDNSITRLYADSEVTMKEVIRGEIIDSEGELLVVQASYGGRTNFIYVNAWNIRSVVEPKHGLSIANLYSSEQEKIRNK